MLATKKQSWLGCQYSFVSHFLSHLPWFLQKYYTFDFFLIMWLLISTISSWWWHDNMTFAALLFSMFRVRSLEYNVTVLVRDPTLLPADHNASKVVVGDVLNKADVKKTMEGQDAVIIILGTRNDLSKSLKKHTLIKTWLYLYSQETYTVCIILFLYRSCIWKNALM